MSFDKFKSTGKPRAAEVATKADTLRIVLAELRDATLAPAVNLWPKHPDFPWLDWITPAQWRQEKVAWRAEWARAWRQPNRPANINPPPTRDVEIDVFEIYITQLADMKRRTAPADWARVQTAWMDLLDDAECDRFVGWMEHHVERHPNGSFNVISDAPVRPWTPGDRMHVVAQRPSFAESATCHVDPMEAMMDRADYVLSE